MKEDVETLREVVIVRLALERRIAETLPDVRQQIAELQAQLDDATSTDRVELLAMSQYEDLLRKKVAAAVEEAWAARYDQLGGGQETSPLELPPWLRTRRSTVVEIEDEDAVPNEYKRADLKAIRSAGVAVPGTRASLKAVIEVVKGKL